MGVKWVPTNKHVYGAIYREHSEDLGVFSSCSCPEGNPQLGHPNPYMMTEWGFKGASDALIKSILTKESIDQKDYDFECFIAHTYNDNEED